MRLRVYRNGRDFVLSRDGVLWEGSEGQIRGDGYSRGDGWRELVVLACTDADAQRLATAIGEVWGGAPARDDPATVDFARDVLGQFAAGTEDDDA